MYVSSPQALTLCAKREVTEEAREEVGGEWREEDKGSCGKEGRGDSERREGKGTVRGKDF